MQKKIILLEEIKPIFIKVLENEELILTLESSSKEIEEWDSLNHIQIVVAIEKHFKIRFTSREIQGWQTVGDLIDTILEKTS